MTDQHETAAPAISDHRAMAMQILTSGAALRSREGGFLGSIAFDPEQPTERQAAWLKKLAERHLNQGGAK